MGTIDELEELNEAKKLEVSIAEQKALIAEAKRRYGSDWRKFFSNVHSGIDWQSVKFKLNSK